MTGKGARWRQQEKRVEARPAIADSAPFKLPICYQINITYAWPAYKINDNTRMPVGLALLPKSSHQGVPNLDYVPGGRETRFAAFCLDHVISPEDQEKLWARVKTLWTHKAKFPPGAGPQGPNLHQWWLGIWKRYGHASTVSACCRDKQFQDMVGDVVTCYDNVFGGKPASLLKNLNPDIAKAMALNHRIMHQHLKLCSGELDPKIVAGKESYKKLRGKQIEKDFAPTREFIKD